MEFERKAREYIDEHRMFIEYIKMNNENVKNHRPLQLFRNVFRNVNVDYTTGTRKECEKWQR